MVYLNIRLPIIANKTVKKKLLVNNLFNKKALNLAQVSTNLIGFLHLLGLYSVFTSGDGNICIVKSIIYSREIKINKNIKFVIVLICLKYVKHKINS